MNSSANVTLVFYKKNKLTTLQSKETKRTIFHSTNHICAEINTPDNGGSVLLATDDASSALKAYSSSNSEQHIYSTYGFSASQPSHLTSIGFNGNHMDKTAGIFLLGLGHRGYSPNTFRFLSPDSFSPFGIGGINAYAYCAGDPINRSDPTGHAWLSRLFKTSKTERAYLKNIYPKLLKKEIALVESRIQSSDNPIRIVTTGADLTSTGTGHELKFVINKNNEMAIAPSGAKDSDSYVSHPAIANKLSNKKIISAGTMVIGSLGDVFMFNRSGHYIPTIKDLEPAAAKLRSLGFEPTISSYTND